MSHLFEPWNLGQLRLANRIVVATMCQKTRDEPVGRLSRCAFF